MYKCFCDRCGKEVPDGKGYRLDYKARWWSSAETKHYCDECWEVISMYLYGEDLKEGAE